MYANATLPKCICDVIWFFFLNRGKAPKGLDNASDYAASAVEEHQVDKPSKEGKDGLIRGDASKNRPGGKYAPPRQHSQAGHPPAENRVDKQG
jgi:hypothetical protein